MKATLRSLFPGRAPRGARGLKSLYRLADYDVEVAPREGRVD